MRAARTLGLVVLVATTACTAAPESESAMSRWGSLQAPQPVIESGTYAVGTDIAPGTYRVSGYWARLDGAMTILDNAAVEDGLAVVDVEPTDSFVEINGAAVPLAERPAVDPVAERFTGGTYLVGIDIAPGRYDIGATGAAAYFERLDADGEVIDDDISEGNVVARIEPTDWAFSYSGTLMPLS